MPISPAFMLILDNHIAASNIKNPQTCRLFVYQLLDFERSKYLA